MAIMCAAWAAEFAECVRGAAARDLAAKAEYHRGLRDLIVRGSPGFQSLATVSMELQIALAQSRREMLDYLLRHDPGRIETTQGLARFRNFGWSDGDAAKLLEESRSYRELQRRIATLRDRNDGHPDWPKLREYFRSGLGQSQEFKALMARFEARQGEVKASIAGCRREQR